MMSIWQTLEPGTLVGCQEEAPNSQVDLPEDLKINANASQLGCHGAGRYGIATAVRQRVTRIWEDKATRIAVLATPDTQTLKRRAASFPCGTPRLGVEAGKLRLLARCEASALDGPIGNGDLEAHTKLLLDLGSEYLLNALQGGLLSATARPGASHRCTGSRWWDRARYSPAAVPRYDRLTHAS